jgi:hypothetical protein
MENKMHAFSSNPDEYGRRRRRPLVQVQSVQPIRASLQTPRETQQLDDSLFDNSQQNFQQQVPHV